MTHIVYVSPGDIPPELALLSHRITSVASAADALLTEADLIIVDGTANLAAARTACEALANGHLPVLLIVSVTGMAVISPDWGFTDFFATGSEPAELDARIRMLARHTDHILVLGLLRLDCSGYTATLNGTALDLTYTEFQLLQYLMQHPGRVLSREKLVSEVWGYDYYGGTRTVDVHVRRLRAKLGQFDYYIGTVRNVGYRFASAREAFRAD